jgi:ribosomal protein L22
MSILSFSETDNVLQLRGPVGSTCARTLRTCGRLQLLLPVALLKITNLNLLNDRPCTGLKLTKAYSYLSDVKDHKQVIPFRRFSGGVGRASQAKQFKATQGGYIRSWKEVANSDKIRSMAREIRPIHIASVEECRIKCRRKKPRARRSLHQEHRCPTSSRSYSQF